MGVQCRNKSWQVGLFMPLYRRKSLFNVDCQSFFKFKKKLLLKQIRYIRGARFFQLFFNRHINLGMMHIFMCIPSLNVD